VFLRFIPILLLVACASESPEKVTETPPASEVDGPWYSTSPESDFEYLPLGNDNYTVELETWSNDSKEVEFDLYRPEGEGNPVAVFLPGAFVVSDRYAWIGHALASHGIAAAIVQPPEDFARSYCTMGTLKRLSELGFDVSRVLLMGHSAGALAQAGLADVSSCSAGLCDADAVTPAGLAGFALLGFHNESGSDHPIAAAEVPWLLVSGSKDGLTIEEEVSATFDRLQDRPVTWLDVKGMNHYQFTGYVDPEEDLRLEDDLVPTIGNEAARATVATYVLRFADAIFSGDSDWDTALDAEADPAVDVEWKEAAHLPYNTAGLDRVMTEPVGELGFDGNDDHVEVVATYPYLDSTWMVVRDEVNGASIWRWDGQATQVPVDWGNPHLNSRFAAMAEFKGELFVGLSSGLQGAARASTGAELWATDGENWRPVIGPTADEDILLAVEDCEPQADGSAVLITDQDLDGLDPEFAFADTNDHAEQLPLFFDVVTFDRNTLTVTQDAIAYEEESVSCEDVLAVGTLALRIGSDEAGFGLPWNKVIIDMTVHEGRLYVSTGLNYVHGPELWMTEDGIRFSKVVGGDIWGQGDDGLPLSTSITALLSWEGQLLAGTTGRSGYGARLLSLDSSGDVTWLVDNSVDEDDVGLDESGFGTGAQQVVDLTFFNGRIWLATLNLNGVELFTTTDPAEGLDTVVGADGTFPAGFGTEDQVAVRMWTVGDDLWLGSIAYARMSKDLDDMSALAWRTRDGDSWQLVSAHAFGVNAPSLSGVFEQDGIVYGAAGFGGLANATSFGPLRLYSLTEVLP